MFRLARSDFDTRALSRSLGSSTRVAAFVAVAALGGSGSTAEAQLAPQHRAALDSVLRSAISAGDVPGVVAMVTSRDSILYHRAFGVLEPSGPTAMQPDAIFPIQSMTKPITSLGIMMLVAEGRLGLDDPASRYLPGLADRAVLVRVDSSSRTVVTRPAAREITIRDLLRHTSGIAYPFSSHEALLLARHTDLADRDFPLLHDPGTRWTYGMSTAHLGWIIEQVTGMPLREFYQARIFGPLGMTNTSFSLPNARIARLAVTYRWQQGAWHATPRPDSIHFDGRGDGGLLSTAEDYAKFVQLILGNGSRGGVRLLDSAWIREMTRDQLEGLTVVEQPGANPALSRAFPLGAGQDGFSLGFQVARARGPDGRAAGSLSWAGLTNTHFWIDPESGIGVILLFQVLPFYDTRTIATLRRVERAIYGISAP